MKKYYYLICFICIFFISNGIKASDSSSSSSEQPVAVKGLIDLRGTDLHKESVSLNGEWGFYWKQLLNPSSAFTNPGYIHFPRLWNNLLFKGRPLSAMGFATYTLTILMPREKKHTLAIEIANVYTSYRLFINCQLYAENGVPGTSEVTSVPKWINKTVMLTDTSDTLHLVLQIANFWHSKGGPYREIVIGDSEYLFHNREKEAAFDLVMTGCLFMGGLFFLGLYLFGRHDKVILYFSLFCIAYSYRLIGAKSYELHSVFPAIPWVVTTHLEYLTLFASVGFFTLYSWYLYPEEFNKWVMTSMTALCSAFMIVTFLFPPCVFTLLINPFLVSLFFFIAYSSYVYIRAAQKKRIGAKYSLLSTAVGFIIAIAINLEYFRIAVPSKEWVFVGYITFFFLQSLILSFRFAYILKKAKEQAEEGLRVKSEFLSTMSHEIRTPLNSVIGLSHLLLKNDPRADQKENLDVLLFSANNLLGIVNDILDYNKIEAGKIKFEQIEMDLTGIVENIIKGLKTFADNKGIELKLQHDHVLHKHLIGDPTRLGQILNNLIHNAIKFTQKGSVVVDIIVERQTENSMTLTISIRDTGIGIAPDKQQMIFERFSQADSSVSRNFGGTGLGLAICKRLLDLQGSSLQLTSEPGKGSVFYFTQSFPVSPGRQPAELAEPDMLPDERTKPLIDIAILLVEDNELNILVAKSLLERWGATVDVARNGQEAVTMLDTLRHKMILMDMHMPVMDGYTATEQMRKKGVTLPIVALTASLPQEVEQETRRMGMDDIIVKPFVPDELYIKVLHYVFASPPRAKL